MQGANRSSLSSALTGIFLREGWRGFYVGIGPAVVRHIPYTSTRIFAYEQFRNVMSAERGCEPSDLPISAKMVLGMTAGGLGQAQPAQHASAECAAARKLCRRSLFVTSASVGALGEHSRCDR